MWAMMPFGFKNAPPTYKLAMNKAFQGLFRQFHETILR
jgi:hypothetical protein